MLCQSMISTTALDKFRRFIRCEMSGSPILSAAVVVSMGVAAVSAEGLQERMDVEGNVHFGTSSSPNLCCMCQPALDYETRDSQTIFILQYGLRRAVANERVFLSGDGKAWYCEGNREMGQSSQKCGLTPQAM